MLKIIDLQTKFYNLLFQVRCYRGKPFVNMQIIVYKTSKSKTRSTRIPESLKNHKQKHSKKQEFLLGNSKTIKTLHHNFRVFSFVVVLVLIPHLFGLKNVMKCIEIRLKKDIEKDIPNNECILYICA